MQDYDKEALGKVAEGLIGLEQEQARTILNSGKYEYRVVRIEGRPCIVTHDLHPWRFNLTITEGKVEKVSFG